MASRFDYAQGSRRSSIQQKEEDKARKEFRNILEQAEHEDFEELFEVPLFTDCGYDISDHRLVLFVPAYLNIREHDDEKLAQTFRFICLNMHALLTDSSEGNTQLDPDKDYVLIYDSASMSWWEMHFFEWLRGHTGLVPSSYVEALQTIYILHPTNTFKTRLLAYYPLMNEHLWQKIKYVDTLDDLCDEFLPPNPHVRAEFKRRFPHLVHREDFIRLNLPPPHVLGMSLTQLCETLGEEVVDPETNHRYPFLPPPLVTLCRVLHRRAEQHGHDAAIAALEHTWNVESTEVYDIVAELDEGEPLTSNITVESIWCALKLWLDCLPVPLFSFQAYQEMHLRNLQIDDRKAHKEFLTEVIHRRLPATHAYAGLYLASFLKQFVCKDAEIVAKYAGSAQQKDRDELPTLRRVAEMFAPCFFRPRCDFTELIQIIGVAVSVTESLVEMADDLWVEQEFEG